jgi:two-component system, LuxR family, response regulator FixJ
MDATVFVIDDDPAVRDSLALLLGLRGLRTQMFESAESFLAAYDAASSGCALIDVRMPGMDGLSLFATIREKQWSLPCIVMSAYGDVAMTREALKSGAFDFLEKPFDEIDVVVDVIQSAISLDATRRLEVSESQALQGRLQRLTARETEVMQLLVEGHSNRQVAEELGISPRTVEVYKARLLEKLQARTITDLVRIAVGAAISPRKGQP